MPKVRVLVQVGHESPRQPGFEANTGAAGEVEVVRKIGSELMARLKADRRFRPRLIPGKVPSDIADGSFPVDAFITLHCDGATATSEGWSLGYPDFQVNRKLAKEIAVRFESFHRSAQRPDNNTTNMSGYYAYALVPTPGPEVLVEHGFVSNPTERGWLHDNVKKLATAEYRALLDHFGLEEPDAPDTQSRTGPAETTRIKPSTKILGPPRASRHQQRVALLSRPHGSYSDRTVRKIANRYVEVATAVGMDPLVVVAQMVLETGNLTSFWSQPPRRNPAGIGVTGEPGAGVRFDSWRQATRAHVGRLLAYALTDAQANREQRELIAMALAVRELPGELRGVAPTLAGLTGTWATDPDYAKKIAGVANDIVDA